MWVSISQRFCCINSPAQSGMGDAAYYSPTSFYKRASLNIPSHSLKATNSEQFLP